MRLTTELISTSLSYLNPLNERELDLRGHKIPTIENLGAASQAQESLDFTDNEISTLGNFPLSPRLTTLLCARNRIARIQPGLGKAVPNLHTLVLTQNALEELADLDGLTQLRGLRWVCLGGNGVVGKENYRYYVVWRAPQIRFLDFQKVKDAEREKAIELFGTFEEPTELARSIMAVRSNQPRGFAAPTTNGTGERQQAKLTDTEKARFSALILRTRSLAEVQRLEKMMNEGRIPPGIADGEAMDES